LALSHGSGGVEAVGDGAFIDGNVEEACGGEARGDGTGVDRGEGAANVACALKPTVSNIEGEEDGAGTEDAEDFGEQGVLELRGLEMVEQEDGYGGRESLRGEGKLGGIATDCGGCSVDLRFQFAQGVVVVLERGDARGAGLQMSRGGAVAGSKFEKMIAERCVRENPGEESRVADVAPEGRGAEEMFGDVHGLENWRRISVTQPRVGKMSGNWEALRVDRISLPM